MLVYGSAPKNQAAGDLTRCRTLSAHRKSGKSFLATDMLFSVARGSHHIPGGR